MSLLTTASSHRPIPTHTGRRATHVVHTTVTERRRRRDLDVMDAFDLNKDVSTTANKILECRRNVRRLECRIEELDREKRDAEMAHAASLKLLEAMELSAQNLN
jgi:hypothetical protein